MHRTRRASETREPGTTLTADLDRDNRLDESRATTYLDTYVAYLPVKVILNDRLISQKSYADSVARGFQPAGSKRASLNAYQADVEVSLDSNGRALARLTGIQLQGVPVAGDMILVQSGGQLMGLRNYFGLAPIPVSGNYQMGGIANLSILQPTAGREALSRDSIVHANSLVALAENTITEMIADTDAADRNTAFQQHILMHGRMDLARRVTVVVQPGGKHVPLGEVAEYCKGKASHYYAGMDQSILSTFAGPDSNLVHVNQSNPRRNLQLHHLTQNLSVPEVPDTATILAEYQPNELLREEAAFLARRLGDSERRLPPGRRQAPVREDLARGVR